MSTTAAPMDSPAALVCIARAAHRIGDRELLRTARRLLRQRYGIEIRFSEAEDTEDLPRG